MAVWYEHPDQKIIDDTLSERQRQIWQVEHRSAKNAPRHERDYDIAWFHLHADIEYLAPRSSIPF